MSSVERGGIPQPNHRYRLRLGRLNVERDRSAAKRNNHLVPWTHGSWGRARRGERGLNEKDLELVGRAQGGDRNALAMVITRYQHYVYRTVYGVVQHAADAEDVTQETFIKMYRSLNALKNVRTFPAWLARIAVNTAMDRINQRDRTKSTALELASRVSGPDEAQRTDLRIDVDRAIERLSPEHRAVLVLREVHGFDYAELAQILRIPVGTVRSRLHHARMQLRVAFDEHGKGGLG